MKTPKLIHCTISGWLLVQFLVLSASGQSRAFLDSVKHLQAARYERKVFASDSLRRAFAAREIPEKKRKALQKMREKMERQKREADSLNRIGYEAFLKNPPKDSIVTDLILRNAAFARIPSAVFQFDSMESLDMASNNLRHAEDADWENLTQLKSLSLSQNELSGRKAFMFKKNTILETLYLARNAFEQVPKKLHKLWALKKLDLSGNQLHNEKCRRLKFRKMRSLESLDLSDNELAKIPRRLRRLKNLERLNLSNNKIHSLKGIQKLRDLKSLNLSFNPVFPNPKYLLKLDSLEHLTLRNCHLVWLPDEIGEMKTLRKLVLPENQLETVPASLGGLYNLESLMLYKNKLKALPEALFNLTQLLWLDVYYNELREIPEAISKLENLEILYVSHNTLDRLPASLGDMESLRQLYAHHNQLEGLPATLANLKYLQILHVQNNLLAQFPHFVLELPELKELKLGNNQIMSFPTELLDMENLTLLGVAGNPMERGTKEHDQLLQVLEKLQKRGVTIQFDIGGEIFGG